MGTARTVCSRRSNPRCIGRSCSGRPSLWRWAGPRGPARSAGDARVRGTNPTAVSWCLTGAVFRALFEIVGLDGYEGREASIVDSVNFWWVLMQPLCRALAQRGGHEQVLESNDVWCRGPAEAEAVL